MPCYDDRNEPEYVRAEARREFRHNSDVAEMLCGLMRQIEARGIGIDWPYGLEHWWAEHQKRDATR